MSASIAIIQFPGSNTERETLMACRRVGLSPVEFLWNEPSEKLSDFDGYVIVGGFAYEDRSRAGVIAALDPIMDQIKVEADKGKPVLDFFEGLNDVVIKLVDLIMLMAPIGVFALIAHTINKVAGDNPSQIMELLGALGYYMFAVIIGLIAHAAITYTGLLKIMTKMPLNVFYRGIAPAQLLAFSTSSSGATLPVTMECCEDELGVSEEVSSFVLPLGATINMDGTALYQAVAAVFIAHTLGMGLDLGAQLTIILTAGLASFGTAAVPGAGIIMLVIILEAVGIPSEGIALILGVDRILDMMRTVINITGDTSVAVIVASSEDQLTIPT